MMVQNLCFSGAIIIVVLALVKALKKKKAKRNLLMI